MDMTLVQSAVVQRKKSRAVGKKFLKFSVLQISVNSGVLVLFYKTATNCNGEEEISVSSRPKHDL